MSSKKMEYIFGCYEFDAYRQINPLNIADDPIEESTGIHEFMHFFISAESNYGMLLYSLGKIRRSNDCMFFSNDTNERYKSITSYLLKSCINVQESFAVFYQWIYLRLKYNVEEAEKFIDELKCNNKEYYEYIKRLLFLIEQLKSATDEEVARVGMAFLYLCIDCLNINIGELIDNNVRSAGQYNRLVSYNNNAEKLIPNVIFKKKLSDLKGRDLSSDKLADTIFSIVSTTTLNKSVDDAKKDFEKVKEFVLNLFPNKNDKLVIEGLLAEIKPQEKTLEEVLFSELPLKQTYNNITPLTYSDAKKKIGNSKYMKTTLLILNGIHFKGNSEKIKNLNKNIDAIYREKSAVVMFDLLDRKIYGLKVDNKDMKEIISDVNLPVNIVVHYKDYDYENNKIISLGEHSRDVYVYCDRTFFNAKEYIDKFSNNKIKFSALKYHSLYVIIFRLNSNTCFFIPVLANVFPLALESIKNNYPRFDNKINEEQIDGEVIRDAIEKREIDIMVSNLYFINIDFEDPRNKKQMKKYIVEVDNE